MAALYWVQACFAWVVRASWQTSVLILLVLAAQWALRNALPARWRHAFWILVWIRMALPFSFESGFSVFNYLNRGPVQSTVYRAPAVGRSESTPSSQSVYLPMEQPAQASVPSRSPRPAVRVPPPFPSFNSMQWLSLVWLAGAVLFLLRIVASSRRVAAEMGRSRRITDRALLRLMDECRRTVGVSQAPLIIETGALSSPALFGVFESKLLVPHGMLARLTDQDVRFVLLHELHHLRQRDILFNWIVVVLCAVHWFNPLVWVAAARFRSDRELLCDDSVLRHLPEGEIKAYGQTMIKLLENVPEPVRAPGLVGVVERRDLMKRRIRLIAHFKSSARRWSWIAASFLLLLATLALTDAKSRVTRTQGTAIQTPAAGEQHQVECRVIDAQTGRPIADAVINGSNRTDQQGRWVMTASRPIWVLVRAGGYVPSAEMVGANGLFPAEVLFRLDRGKRIGGIVRNENGTPIRGVSVEICGLSAPRPSGPGSALDSHTVLTREDGRWEYTETPKAAESLGLNLSHAQYLTASYFSGSGPQPFQLWSGAAPKAIRLEDLTAGQAVMRMAPGVRIGGIVLDAVGAPVAGASVSQMSSKRSGPPARIVTDASGRFTFANGISGTLTLRIEAHAFAPVLQTIEVSPGMKDIRILLPSGNSIHGRVVNETGRPLADATVSTSPGMLYRWTTRTDDDGRFRWDSAPASPLQLRVSAEGYNQQAAFVEPGSKEYEITLKRTKTFHVTGMVTDADTHQPIPEFQVLCGIPLTPAGLNVDYCISSVGRNGQFGLDIPDSFVVTPITRAGPLDEPGPFYIFRVEAEGYTPEVSQNMEWMNGPTLQFSLKKGRRISGVVLEPGGRPAEDAEIGLIVDSAARNLNPHVDQLGQMLAHPIARMRTDASGSFSFNPERNARVLAVVHWTGVAQVSLDTFPVPGTIRLLPWGRIQGTLWVGNKPAPQETVSLSDLIWETYPAGLAFRFRTQTDAEGRFIFTNVPPGEHQLAHVRFFSESGGEADAHGVPVLVKAGETTQVKLGGTGRPVIGRVVVDGQHKKLYWQNFLSTLALQLPQFPMKKTVGQEFLSESHIEYLRIMRHYIVDFSDDGSFRIEDVPAGRYNLWLKLPLSPGRNVNQEVIVPEMPGGRSDVPLDVGTITVKP